jgi:hypothetical protein
LGESERTEGCIDRESPSFDVTSRPQTHRRRSEGEMGKVEGKEVGEFMTLWVCTMCWTIMPRIEAEKRSGPSSASSVIDWKCAKCGAIDNFADDTSPEFADFANDLVFEAYASHLQEAGYEIHQYSENCDVGRHSECHGESRMPDDVPSRFKRCWCPCHH